jgi:hypothetical protein
VKTTLKVQCLNCGCWNFLEVATAKLNNPHPEQHRPILAFRSLKTQKCIKCETVLTEFGNVFRIKNGEAIMKRARKT